MHYMHNGNVCLFSDDGWICVHFQGIQRRPYIYYLKFCRHRRKNATISVALKNSLFLALFKINHSSALDRSSLYETFLFRKPFHRRSTHSDWYELLNGSWTVTVRSVDCGVRVLLSSRLSFLIDYQYCRGTRMVTKRVALQIPSFVIALVATMINLVAIATPAWQVNYYCLPIQFHCRDCYSSPLLLTCKILFEWNLIEMLVNCNFK